MFTELCLVGLFGVLLYLLLKPRPPQGFPPGPKNFPIVGGALSLASLGSNAADQLENLGLKYGPISGLYFGKTPSIVINDYELSKEIFGREDFAHRPSIYLFDHLYKDRMSYLGVFFANGELWKEQRRFTLRTLRNLGFGKSSLEGLINEEAEECITSFKKAIKNSPDSVTTIHDKFGISMINILWAVVSGQRFSHDDEKLKRIMTVITESFRSGNSAGSFLNDYPWLRHVPIANRGFNAFMGGFKAVKSILTESLEDHKLEQTRDADLPRDFIDAYLHEMDTEMKKGNNKSTFSEEQLLAVCQDLFNAGAESTSNTVAFAMLYMILHPEAQEKVHAELDRVVGRGRLPSLEDKPQLDYVEAVMTECYRLNPISPVSVPRTVLQDTKFQGHVIPKNAMILINIQSIHRDKTHWDDPLVFRPERFLDAEGKFVKPERVIPFGMGRRVCLGEPLARMSAFLLFTAVIHSFKFTLPPNHPRPTTLPLDGFTVAPLPFSAIVTARN